MGKYCVTCFVFRYCQANENAGHIMIEGKVI